MSADLSRYRVIADGAATSPSKEDWYQQIAKEHASVADVIRETLLASDFAPQNSADLEQWVTTLTAAAVTCYYDTLPDGTFLVRGTTKLTNIQLATAAGLAVLPIAVAIDVANGEDLGRALTEAVIGVAGTLIATAGLAAVGISSGAVVIPLIAGWAVTEVLQTAYDYYVTPEVRQKYVDETETYEVVTRLKIDTYLGMYWNRLSKFDNWELSSTESDLKIRYRNGKSENIFIFNKNQINQNIFYKLLENSGSNFNVEWPDGVTDTVINYYHDTVDNLKGKAESSDEALYALVSLRPFILQTEQAANYNALNRADYSENYLQDRARFLYHYVHPQQPSHEEYPVEYTDVATGEHILVGKKQSLLHFARYTFGTDGGNDLHGTNFDDHLYGMGGNDTLRGYGGDDYLEGGRGYDRLYGGKGDDTFGVYGEDGAYDLFNGGEGYDRIIGGDGDDTIRMHEFHGENTVEEIDGRGGFNTLAGSVLSDRLDFSGTLLKNIHMIDAGAGNDEITGSSGNDIIQGGAGNDMFKGGGGEDRFEDSSGFDTYLIAANQICHIADADGRGLVWVDQGPLDSYYILGKWHNDGTGLYVNAAYPGCTARKEGNNLIHGNGSKYQICHSIGLGC